MTFELSGLRSNADNVEVRQLCEGTHLVAVDTELDNFTGCCSGKATVSIRVKDGTTVEKLRLRLLQQQLVLRPTTQRYGRPAGVELPWPPATAWIESRAELDETVKRFERSAPVKRSKRYLQPTLSSARRQLYK